MASQWVGGPPGRLEVVRLYGSHDFVIPVSLPVCHLLDAPGQ